MFHSVFPELCMQMTLPHGMQLKKPKTAMIRMQDTVNRISEWARHWGVQVNTSKTVSTCFSLSKKPEVLTLSMNGNKLPQEDNPTSLGITLDRTLTWNAQIQKSSAKSHKTPCTHQEASRNNLGSQQSYAENYIHRICSPNHGVRHVNLGHSLQDPHQSTQQGTQLRSTHYHRSNKVDTNSRDGEDHRPPIH